MNVQRIISHCAVLFLSAAPISAQITIDATYFHAHLDNVLNSTTYTMNMEHYPALDAIAEATGGGQTYDFSVFTYAPGVPNQIPVFGSADGTPGEGDSDFGAANYVQFQDYTGGAGFWSYVSLTDDGYDFIGSIFRSESGEQISKNLPSNRFYEFPLTMGSSWDQTIEIQSVSFGFEFSVTVNEHSEVDGWGTLITPAGSAPCIRLRKTTTLVETGKTATTTDNYFFLTNSNIAASISYSSEIEGAIIATHSTLGGTGGTGTAVEELPTPDFRLTQNFPNPFSRSTTIAFELDSPSDAQLRVFDLMGREVARLVDGPLAAGSHRAELGTEGLTSGVYVYKLEVGGLVSMRTLTILK